MLVILAMAGSENRRIMVQDGPGKNARLIEKQLKQEGLECGSSS
jgi:hypothetical protein